MVTISLMGALGGVVRSPLFAQDLTPFAAEKKQHPKIESTLGMLKEKYSQSRAAAQHFAQQRRIPYKDNKVTAILVPPPGEDVSAIDKASLAFFGAVVEASSRHLLRARIPLPALEKIADGVRGISYIRLPYIPCPLGVVSEGVGLSGASVYHGSGYEGQGTKVAIIDLGFIGLSAAQANGELPSTAITQDFTGRGIEADDDHGTAVAEILYDMAPGAELYLIKIDDEVELENAKDYCITQGVDIINHSVGWVNTNFTDGAGIICDTANDARTNGILWVNAAGNSAKRHYQAPFLDKDTDNWHEFAPADETNEIILSGFSDIYLFLTWDSWPATAQDYDLYLYYEDDFTTPVAFSRNQQTGTQPPQETICYPNAPAGIYHIAIDKYSASGAQELKIFTFYQNLEYETPLHSLMAPADATGVMAVAAINQANWATGPQENFSSQGPTNDARTKPDISGPDGVSNFTYGSFYGTSASSPHVAGAASLLLSREPTRTANDLQTKLESDARALGSSGKDNIYGWGRLNLTEPVPPQVSSTYPAANTTNISTSSNITATFSDDMKASTLNSSTITVAGSVSGAHTGVVSYDSPGKTITFNPDLDFALSETITVTITTGVQDLAGNGLDGNKNGIAEGSPDDNYSWSFATIPSEELKFYKLFNYPNPTEGTTTIRAEIETPQAQVTIKIFDVAGRLVKVIEASEVEAKGLNLSGTAYIYESLWNGKNEVGSEVASGVYFYLVEARKGDGIIRKTGKIAVIK